MGVAAEIAELSGLLKRLRAADPGLRVFGSEKHKYRLNPVLPEASLAAFEASNAIRIPEDYRHFLDTIGNGNAGPYYGITPLDVDGRDLAGPFPFTRAVGAEEAAGSDSFANFYEPPGALELGHIGCGNFALLALNGPAAGTVWYGGEGIYPTGRTFAAWYRRWLEGCLTLLANDPLIARLRVGMSAEDVRAATGLGWRARPMPGDPARSLFEPDDLAVQLVLDDRGRVVEVRPWPFIQADLR